MKVKAVNAKDIIDALQGIQNSFIGFEPGVGYSSLPGPSSDVRIARAVYLIEGLKRELGVNQGET